MYYLKSKYLLKININNDITFILSNENLNKEYILFKQPI